MITSITLECPYCKQVSDVYLSADATYVILNCPGCLHHIIYHEKICAVLNRQQVHHIIHAHQTGSVEQMLVDIINRARNRLTHQRRWPKPQRADVSFMLSRGDRNKPPISCDDILNLRIALERCHDAAEFIAAM